MPAMMSGGELLFKLSDNLVKTTPLRGCEYFIDQLALTLASNGPLRYLHHFLV